MKWILSLLLLVTTPAFAQWHTADQTLNQIYGARVTACTQDTDVDTFTTTVDSDSASGQKVLKLTATTDLAATDWVVVNPGGVREEACYVASVSAGDSVTCTDNLVYTHTAVQGDTVNLTNRLPKTGSGFTVGRRYRVQCYASGVPVLCEIIFGGATVDAGSVIGETIIGSNLIGYDRTFLILSTGRFASVLAADATTVDFCPMD